MIKAVSSSEFTITVVTEDDVRLVLRTFMSKTTLADSLTAMIETRIVSFITLMTPVTAIHKRGNFRQ